MAVKFKVSPVKAHKRCVKIAFYIEVNCIDLIKVNALMRIHLVVLFIKHFMVLWFFPYLTICIVTKPTKHQSLTLKGKNIPKLN